MYRPTWSSDKASLRHICDSPSGAAIENADAALDHLLLVSVRDAHLRCDPAANLMDRARLPVLQGAQTGRHEGLIVRDGHADLAVGRTRGSAGPLILPEGSRGLVGWLIDLDGVGTRTRPHNSNRS